MVENVYFKGKVITFETKITRVEKLIFAYVSPISTEDTRQGRFVKKWLS